MWLRMIAWKSRSTSKPSDVARRVSNVCGHPATIAFGISTVMWLSMLALAVMGAADTVSVVIRFSLVQLATPDDMRGRVGAVNFLFINASNQLGQFESGITAALLGTVPAAVLGGVGTVAVALLWMKLFPSLRKVERLE